MSFPTAVHLVPRYPVWVPGGGNPRFSANLTIAVKPGAVLYTPPLNETLKFGWIQYLAFFLPLWFVLRELKYFAAVFQITPCRVVVDRQQVRKISDHDF
jgi:transmembrane protein 231